MRFEPEASAALMAPTGVLGLAMKNWPIGIDVPGVGPLVQVGPVESCCTAGTNTLKPPSGPVYRYGSSWVTGLVASVVYGPGPPGTPKLCGGAPWTPANTWSHTPFVQPSIELFLRMNCCCDPLRMVLPVNLESAMKPPLANCGPAVQ